MEVSHFFDPQSMDLNTLYQQDIDLGVDWLNFEPVKSVKEVQLDEKKHFDLDNFIVDGETGEYLPRVSTNQQQETDKCSETGQNAAQEFNIDDCLDFLQTSIGSANGENIQPVSEAVRAATITDLSSLIQTTEDTVTEPISSGIWDDIAALSELTGLAFDANDLTSDDSSDGSETTNMQTQYQSLNQFQNDVYGTITPMTSQVQEQQSTLKDQYYNMDNSYHNYPTPPYTERIESPTSFSQPLNVTYSQDNEDTFTETNMTELLMSQQPDLLLQLDNSQIAPPPLNANQVITPGSWFFGGEEPGFQQELTDLDMANNMNIQNAPFLNPPNAPYVPPPIREMDPITMKVTNVTMLSESSDSESGILMDNFNDGNLNLQQMDIEMHDPDQSVLKPSNRNDAYSEIKRERTREEKRASRESRDLKKARELNITLTLEQIVNTPVEEYNEILARTPLTAVQQTLVRDIRRRGKNKVAAQNCRKRKIETISSMEIDIDELNMKRQSLVNKQKEIEATRKSIKSKYMQLYQKIFRSLRDDSGRPYDPSRFSLEQVEGAIILVPRGNRMKMSGDDNRMETNRTVAFFDLSKVKIEKQD